MKTFPLIILGFFFLAVLPTQVQARSDWKITSFESTINIQNDGTVAISEKIAVDFGTLEKHGIFRNIPFEYQNKGGSKTYLNFEVKNINRNGQAEKYSESKSGGNLVIQIGDPNQTISGTQSYQIEYTVIGALLGYESFDELYWNVTGNYWEVPIERASANTVLPGEGIVQSACYQGAVGSSEECRVSEVSATTTLFETTRQLGVGEGMTLALGYKKGLVPLLVGEAPKTVVDDFSKPVNLLITLAILILGGFFVLNLWLRKGRDFWFGRNYLLGSETSTVPVGAKETIVVEYSSPENLRPAELAALSDEKAETLDVTATIIDLANRGFLTITEKPKKWAFGTTDYIFKRINKDTKGLLEYEEALLLRLFDDGERVKMSELKNKFYKDLAAVKEKLYLNLADKKFFVENPDKVRSRYSLYAVLVGLVGGGVVWLGFAIVTGLFVMIGGVLVLLSITFLIFAQFMPARTALGRKLFARAQGYRLFIETSEKYRQQFFEKKNLFNEVLPYAIVFGLTEKFAKAFEKMGIEPQQPSWYHSSSVFHAAAFGRAMNSFSTSVSNSIASSPRSSGSGGGGSSGGGFGGGGGGSW